MTGVVPSYEAYSQHVSQIGESQARLTPSPQRSHRAATCLKTPEGRTCVTPDRTPLIQQMTVDALNGKEDSQEWPQDYEKRAVLGTLRTIGRHNEKRPQDQVDELVDLPLAAQATETSFSLDPISAKSQVLNLEEGTPESEVLNSVEETAEAHARNLVDEPVEEDTREMTGLQVDCVRELSMPRSSSPVHVLTRVELTPSKTLHNPEFRPKDNPQVGFSDDEDRHREKRRRLSPGSGHASAEESPDSLAGKSIAVVARSDDPVNDSVIDPRMEQHLPASSHTATSNPQTPTINHSLQGSPANSFGPASSLRSTRSAVREDSNPSTQECGMRILFASSTSVGDSKAFKKFLREHEVKTVQSFDDATCLCVGKGELKKTSKLISAVLLGLDIITDDWVTDSARLKKLQDTHAYLARDPQRESEWGIKLDEAIERGRRKVRVFEGRNIAFTTKLKKELGNTNFADLKEIAVCAGARKVGTSLPKESSDSNATTLIIGSLDDNDTPALQEKRFFTKEMISLSVLRGHLDTESDEFLIEKEPPQRKGNKKRMR